MMSKVNARTVRGKIFGALRVKDERNESSRLSHLELVSIEES